MGRLQLRRAAYRVGQFVRVLMASTRPLTPAEEALAQRHLPPTAWSLFAAMSRADQRHGLAVLAAVQAAGQSDPALMQAALLHDCAKRAGDVHIWHRVARVLLKAFAPTLFQRWAAGPAPRSGTWRRGLWAYLHHPALGAALAAAAGCDPLAVALIRYHEERAVSDDPQLIRLLRILQAADEDV